jgi:hypothetical protein
MALPRSESALSGCCTRQESYSTSTTLTRTAFISVFFALGALAVASESFSAVSRLFSLDSRG